MDTKTATRHTGTTVLAYAHSGQVHRGGDDREYDRMAVILDTGMWKTTYPIGNSTRNSTIRRATGTKVRPSSASGYGTGVTGWLVLHTDYDTPTDERAREMLLGTATELLKAGLPENAKTIELPKGLEVRTVIPRRIHNLVWDELAVLLAAQHEEADRKREERDRSVDRSRATLEYGKALAAVLGVDEAGLFPEHQGWRTYVSADDGRAVLPVVRLLERLARAEGVELPPRPEHLPAP